MRTNVVSLIPQIELDIIEAYLFDKGEYEFEEYLDEAEVPEPSETSRLSVAVAQILLNRIQGTLPHTAIIFIPSSFPHSAHSLKTQDN